MPVIPWVKKQRLFDAHVLAAHCVHVDDGEMRTLKEAHAGVAHNPTSNLKLGSGIAPVAKMLEHGIAVGIGTDGPASNNDLDMFEEIRLAALLAKGAGDNPTALPARDALAMATRMGARRSASARHRIARARQARRSHRRRSRSDAQRAALRTRSERDLLAAGLRRQVHRRRRRDVRRPMADARPAPADARRSGVAIGGAATSPGASTRS